MAALVLNPTTSHCPNKGDASYLSVGDGATDVAWSYEDPFDQLGMIKGHLAFYPERVDTITASTL